MTPILVIGASGNVGRQVVLQLAAAGRQVRALTRRPDVACLPQVEVVQGDLTSPESLDGCLDGIEAVFLVWTATPAAFGPAFDRIRKHARRMVFLSAPLKTPHPFFQQPNPSRVLAEQIELDDRNLRTRLDVPAARNDGRKFQAVVGAADSLGRCGALALSHRSHSPDR